MSETAFKVGSDVEECSEVDHFPAALLAVLVIYLGACAYTLAHFMGDTNVYVQAILPHRHSSLDDYHLTTSNPFLDFGHLLWRPLGWLCFMIARPATQLLAHQNQ